MRDELLDILDNSAAAEATAWLRDVIASQETSFQQRSFYYAFSGVSRHFDKTGRVACEGSPFDGWDEFRIARVALLSVLAEQEETAFLESYLAILNTADLREQVALFSALPFLPDFDALIEPVVDGLRSNIVDVFDAIALDNPFPAQHFSDEAWTQMVLKAIFIERPLYRIIGLEERKNQLLSEAISDLAHERWAAGRTITPEAWQNSIGFIDERLADDIKRISESERLPDRHAAALVASADASGKLDPLRPSLENLIADVDAGTLTWASLGESLADLENEKE